MAEPDELAIMAAVRAALLELPDTSARARVLRWAWDSAGLAQPGAELGGPARLSNPADLSSLSAFTSLADLLDATQPDTRADRILTVAYWLESSTGETDFSSQAINDELKNLGEGVPNITVALAGLINRKPALVRQTRKSGRSQQARKRYALTTAGRSVVVGRARKQSQGVD